MNPRDIENQIAEEDFRHQLKEDKRVLDLSNVTYCAKCDKEDVGYGIRGELCKECDHLMRLDAM